LNKRERNWEKIIASNKVQPWLNKEDENVLQIIIRDFPNLTYGPAKLIPTFHSKEIPVSLRTLGLELIRNRKGGCLLIKRKSTDLPTLFPKLDPPVDRYDGQSFQSIPELSVLANPKSKLVNEETGIHLAWATGILQAFFMEIFSSYEQFAFGGRLKTTVKGSYRILGEEYEVAALVEADGYFESRERIIVLEAKQSKNNMFCSDFSIHQLVLPLMLVRGITDKPSTGLFLDFSIDKKDEQTIVRYRLYHYDIPGMDTSIDPFKYEFLKSKEYIVTIA